MTDKRAGDAGCVVSYFQEAKMPERQIQAQTRKNGFTLIELLVVIAIIAILAAILFPVFFFFFENARRSSFQSNLKQIGLSVFHYMQDYDEKLPLYITGGAYEGWADSVQPYIKSIQILQCPSESSVPTTTPGTGNYTDYWINLLSTGQSDAAFNATSSTVLLGDGQPNNVTGAWSVGGNTSCVYAYTVPLWECTLTPTTTLAPATLPPGGAHRHLSGANFAFADGHVKWQKGGPETTDKMASVYEAGNTTTTTAGAPTFSIK